MENKVKIEVSGHRYRVGVLAPANIYRYEGDNDLYYMRTTQGSVCLKDGTSVLFDKLAQSWAIPLEFGDIVQIIQGKD